MTTIAYKDGVMAADTMVGCDGIMVGNTQKIEYLIDHGKFAYLGISGDLESQLLIRNWIQKALGGDFDCEGRPETSSNSMLLLPDGDLLHFDGKNLPMTIDAPFYAIGSGKDLAIGAMAYGASAVEAVKIACKYDLHSGCDDGGPQVVKLSEDKS